MTTLPKSFAQIPRVRVLYPEPSPIHPLQALTTSFNNATTTTIPTTDPSFPRSAITAAQPPVTIHAKREDHSSPLACAGNKYRKLEYIIPDILNPTFTTTTTTGPVPPGDAPGGPTIPFPLKPGQKVTTLVTEGAVQSNHTIQVAAVAQKLGLGCVAILHKGTGGGLAAATDPDVFMRVGNVQIARLLGADMRLLDKRKVYPGHDEKDQVSEILDDLVSQGKVPYWIPSGASLHPLGGLGYARCAFEIAAQEQTYFSRPSEPKPTDSSNANTNRFDYIFLASGSGSTIAGLLAGFKLLDQLDHHHQQSFPPRKIIGILNSPTKPHSWHHMRILHFARAAGHLIGLAHPEVSLTADDIHIDSRWAGERYGVLDAETKRVLEMGARMEGVVLDPVYTAKTMRGVEGWVGDGEVMRDWVERGGDTRRQVNVLFLHTGGQAALGAYADVD